MINTNSPLYKKEIKLRIKVLRKPLGLPDKTVFSPYEEESIHLVAIDKNNVIGCVLFYPKGVKGRLYQMAIDPKYQKMRIGTKLINTLEDKLKKDNFDEIYIHARHYVVNFYEKLGYVKCGKPFEEIGIKHFLMKKSI